MASVKKIKGDTVGHIMHHGVSAIPPDLTDNIKFYGRIRKFEDLEIESDFNLNSTSGNFDLMFVNITFSEQVLISISEFKNPLVFNNCNFHKSATFTRGKENNLTFSDCGFNNLNIINASYENILIAGCNGNISLTKTTFNHFIIGNWLDTKVNTLSSLNLNLSGSEIIRLVNPQISRFTISGTLSKQGSILCESAEVQTLLINHFTNEGHFRINNLLALIHPPKKKIKKGEVASSAQSVKNAIIINKSDLGAAYISEINMKKFDIVNIGQSNIYDVKFSNILWPKRIFPFAFVKERDLTEKIENPFSKEDHLKTRDLYRQLKLASTKGSDYISEQFFHSKEMDAYRASLSWWSAPWTKVILILSSWTSNYGQSLWKPIAWLIGIVTLIMLIQYRLYETAFQSCDFHLPENIWNWISEFLRLSNPLHKNHCELTGVPFILDTLLRIITSYLIYNIIRATRRFVK